MERGIGGGADDLVVGPLLDHAALQPKQHQICPVTQGDNGHRRRLLRAILPPGAHGASGRAETSAVVGGTTPPEPRHMSCRGASDRYRIARWESVWASSATLDQSPLNHAVRGALADWPDSAAIQAYRLARSAAAREVGTLRAVALFIDGAPRGASSTVEQRTFNPLVQGSSPWRPTTAPPLTSYSKPLTVVAGG
jgi:hypothetical protein